GRISGRASEEVVPGNPGLGLGLVAVGLGAAYLLHFRIARPSPQPAETGKRRYREAVLSVLALSSCVPVFLAGRDMFTTRKGDVDGQARLLHLFTYNYDRE